MIVQDFEEKYGHYRKHPRAVLTGFESVPILEQGQFYVIRIWNHKEYSRSNAFKQDMIVRCDSPAVFHRPIPMAEPHQVSYLMSTLGVSDSGCAMLKGYYHWFREGRNVILHLPEGQQLIYRNMWRELGRPSGCEFSSDF